MRLPDLTHGFLVSFAEPGAIAPVLVPLDTYGKGFCRELLYRPTLAPFLTSLSRTLPGGEADHQPGQMPPARPGVFLYLGMSRIAQTDLRRT
jgi:hypothetical protein